MPVSLGHSIHTSSCNSCSSKDDLMGLTIGRYTDKYPNSGQVIILCRACRKRLLEILDSREMDQLLAAKRAQLKSNRR